MDPVTAIGLACNVLQLAETGIKIGKQIHEAYKSGTPSAFNEVREWAEGIANINAEVQSKVPAFDKKTYAFDDDIIQLSKQTTAHADKLRAIIDDIFPTNGTASTPTNSLGRRARSLNKSLKRQ